MQSQPQKLADIVPAGRYETPRLLQTTLVLPAAEQGGPIRILLHLEGGYELEVEATPQSRGEFYQALNAVQKDRP